MDVLPEATAIHGVYVPKKSSKKASSAKFGPPLNKTTAAP